MGGGLEWSVVVAANYQGSGGGGSRQYNMCNDHHRLSPAVNKMSKNKNKNKNKNKKDRFSASPDQSRWEWEVGVMDGEGKDAWVVGKGQR